MQITLLGPLAVVVDGEAVVLPGAGERALLTLLALEPGRVVSADRLIDALWGEDLPANPANALQIRVSKLRKLVGDVVQTRAPGYTLTVDADCVDVHRFRDLTAAGRHADALALWRGPALAEFHDEQWAAAVSTRLEQERLLALEERVHADLAAGRHADVVAELDGLVAAHPLRERFRAQQMLALYRCGRQADALAAFQEAGRVLGEELGLDPGRELQELQAAILRQDHALAPPHAPVRGRIPSRTSEVIGREAELDRAAALVDDNRLVTLTGPGGTGKTTLAVELAHRLAPRHPDGVWFVALAEVTEAERLADVVLAEVGVVSPDAPSARAVLASYLADRRALLVLDNCEHVVDATAALAHHLLRSTEHLRILATSRSALGVSGEVQLTVPPLSHDDAIALFATRARAVSASFDLTEASTPHVAAICERLDRMPLAIELAAVRTRSLPVDVIARRLDDRFSLLASGPRTAASRHRTLQATVDWSHDLLDGQERTLFRRLAVFAGSWALEDAETVCAGGDLVSAQILDVLDRLVDQSLVTVDDGRFRMLETIRVFAAERLASSDEDEDLQAAHGRHFTVVVERAEEGLRGPRQVDWLNLLRTNDANLRAALAWARGRGSADPDALLRLAASLSWFWYVGRQREGREELAAALASADGASPDVLGRALQAVSVVERPGGCIVHPSARAAEPARRSAELFEESGDRHRALISRVLASVEAVGGADVDATLSWLADAAVELVQLGDEWTSTLAEFVAMEINVHQRSMDDAVTVGERVVERFRRIGDQWGTSATLSHLGAGLRLTGRYDEAQAALERGLADARKSNMQNTVAGILIDLALLAVGRGDLDGVDGFLTEAGAVSDELGNRMFHGYAGCVRALADYHRGDMTRAAALAETALAELRQEGVLAGVSRAAALLAMCAVRTGNLRAARTHADAALAAAHDVHNAGLEARALEVLAAVTASDGDAARAAELLGSAARIRVEHQRPADAVEAADVAWTGQATT